ncbi:MAG: UTP--glucose-1-phosphate uridylyltransferase [Chitinivibrionales bacterium]|nr:UTP--glucose-1-phosphate uridylyltransferase [Chitinivibrionales bacterium]
MNNIPETLRAIMQTENLPPLAIDIFLNYYQQLAAGHSGTISEAEIAPVEQSDILSYEALDAHEKEGRKALAYCAIVKLNGGLGTTMGLAQAKSLIPVKDGYTFLEIALHQTEKLRQRFKAAVPLMLMNSFYTDRDCAATLLPYRDFNSGLPLSFVQHKFPKIRLDTLEPARRAQDGGYLWNPPGHGDLYAALVTSGIMQKLLAADYRYLFVSNIDNLGATLDPAILGYCSVHDIPFCMEITPRTAMDKKGGHLAKTRDGRLLLREVAQCPPAEMAFFSDIERYRYFNANNLWINLPHLKRLLDLHGNRLPLPLIINKKNLDVADPHSASVYQLESAMGSAIALFNGATALLAPPRRFAPVKNCDELLKLRSDCYTLTEDFTCLGHPHLHGAGPLVALDKNYFGALADFEARFPAGAPSLVDCTELKVSGDVRFGRGITVIGKVSIVNKSAHQAVIADNATLTGAIELG